MSAFFTEENERNQRKVIIIGAGPSGISAARSLHLAGYDPIVLEARSRIGGRMFCTTMYPDLTNDNVEAARQNSLNIQLGANWIHGLHDDINPMYTLSKKLGLRLHQTSSDDDPGDDVLLFDTNHGLLSPRGRSGQQQAQQQDIKKEGMFRVPKEEYQQVIQRYGWIRENFEDYACVVKGNGNGNNAEEKSDDITVQKAFDLCIQASEDRFGTFTEVQRRCFNWLLDRVAIDMGNVLSKVHKKSYSEGDSSGLYGEAIIIDGGFFQLIDYLAKEYPLDIRCNQAVSTIRYQCADDDHQQASFAPGQYSNVVITCENGEQYFADYCIVTVPIGVLQANYINFHPAVPRCISNLSKKLKMGLMNLVWLWFPYSFWPKNFNFFGVAHGSNETIEDNPFSTFLAPVVLDRFGNPQPILMCQVKKFSLRFAFTK